jgi:hypothetical protein
VLLRQLQRQHRERVPDGRRLLLHQRQSVSEQEVRQGHGPERRGLRQQQLQRNRERRRRRLRAREPWNPGSSRGDLVHLPCRRRLSRHESHVRVFSHELLLHRGQSVP